MSEAERAEPLDLTDAIGVARRGFRRDVAQLIEQIPAGALFVALARSLPDAPLGEEVELEEELTLSPQMLGDAEGHYFLPVFTQRDSLERLGAELGWRTDEGPLEYATLPASVVLEIALEVIDDDQVVGMVVNPGETTELVLSRRELGSIAQGQPLPLVGYVAHIPADDDAQPLIAEPDSAPPSDLIEAIEQGLSALPEVSGYRVAQTFDAERDLEPHLTLVLSTRESAIDSDRVNEHLIARLEGKLPPPGYIDVLFEATETPHE